jgi:DUF971 family protein
MTPTPPAHPLEIALHQKSGQLQVLWSDGLLAQLASTPLRAACRCAGCESQRRAGLPPVPPADTLLTELRPVGEFGLQLCFSDGHDRGIYPWAYLHELSVASPFQEQPA